MKRIVFFLFLAFNLNVFAQISKIGLQSSMKLNLKSNSSIIQTHENQINITKLFDFDCQYPYFLNYRSNLVNDGTYIYGMMTDISYEKNLLIRIKPDGTDFKEVYSFENSINHNFISILGNTIYGKIDGSSIFKINTDGSNYTKMDLMDKIGNEEFIGSFVVSSNILYGTIERIVADGIGTRIFIINTDGTGFSIVYSSDGIHGLKISENTLISFKDDGIKSREMFRINSNGSGYYNFGITSVIEIVTKGSVIYGEAYDNKVDGWNIFKVNMDGTGYAILKSFSNSVLGPFQSLAISGNALLGISYNNDIFKINLDGTDFVKIPTDLTSNEPYYEPTLIGEMLYGLSPDNLSLGVLFQVNTTNNSYSKVFKFGTSTSGMFPIGTPVESGNFLYGNTYSGGSYDMGTIFRINKDGSNYTKLFDFQSSETSAFPVGQLTLVGNQLYGTTSGGWDQIDYGCIFKINADGSGFTILHKFDYKNGAYPNGSLVLHKGILYGITSDGGVESHGVVFRINTDGSGFTKISDNTDFDTGENPSNGIIISDYDVIYGVSTVDYGSIFRVNIDGTGLRKVFEMNNETGDFSYCKPLLINDELYITTSEGGTNGVGTIFKISTDGTGLSVLHNFEGFGDYGSDFGNNSLLFHNGALYGTAKSDGVNDHGYLYRINLDGTGFIKLSDFNGEYGSMPYLCDLIIDKKDDIYGMTTSGGKYSGGIIYKYSLNTTSTFELDNNKNKSIQVYPNPASSTLFIKGLDVNSEVSIFDLNGCLVVNKNLKGNQIGINELAKGVYILKILHNNSYQIVKFIKQ